jgi:glycosyltransferase involved in cell wall biosynthesis
MRVVCVIPAFNEESTIGAVVDKAKSHCNLVLVIDDGSNDETAIRAREAGGRVASHITRLGVGAALSTGLSLALRSNADIIVTLDGDGQHDPGDIPSVIAPLLDERADIVIGSRMLKGSSAMPFFKRIGNEALSIVTSLVCGTKIDDSQSGFRAFSREVAEIAKHGSVDYRWASEMLILSSRKKLRIVAVPIRTLYFKRRLRGIGISDAVKILYNALNPK